MFDDDGKETIQETALVSVMAPKAATANAAKKPKPAPAQARYPSDLPPAYAGSVSEGSVVVSGRAEGVHEFRHEQR